jgi:hypothetical protein
LAIDFHPGPGDLPPGSLELARFEVSKGIDSQLDFLKLKRFAVRWADRNSLKA